jgi:hypothetical protein
MCGCGIDAKVANTEPFGSDYERQDRCGLAVITRWRDLNHPEKRRVGHAADGLPDLSDQDLLDHRLYAAQP